MARMVGPRGSVCAMEIDPGLASRAEAAVASIPNLEMVVGDGVDYEGEPCDAILVNAGVTHPSRRWLTRLKSAGRLLLPLTFEFPNSHLGKGMPLKIVRSDGAFEARFLQSPIVIFSCESVRRADINEQLVEAFSTRMASLGDVKSFRLEAHEREPNCWLHTEEGCLSSRPTGSG